MRIGLLECDHVADRYRDIAGDYRDMFARWLGRAASDLQLEPFDVCNGELPASADACDAWLCGGSRWSAFDDVAWLPPLRAFVRTLREGGQPFVGICFGHQVLADALGGRVARAELWGVGVGEIEVTRREAWMQPSCDRLRLLSSHQDQIEMLPPDAVVLARSEHCPVAMFRVGESMLGIQGHPEITPDYADALLVDRIERIGAARVERARASLATPTDADRIGLWVAAFVRQHAAVRAGESPPDRHSAPRSARIDPEIM
jgi:GMP synthase-like glutamine amidotransferase